MAAAAAEHSSPHQFNSNVPNCNASNTKQFPVDINENQVKPPHNAGSFNNFFQISNLFSQSQQAPNSLSYTEDSSKTQSVNNWFINALSQYSLANKAASIVEKAETEQDSFCY